MWSGFRVLTLKCYTISLLKTGKRERKTQGAFFCLFVCFLNGKINYFVWGSGQWSSLRTSGMLVGAIILVDLEHVEVHHLAQGPALAHCDTVADSDIPEAGGKVHRHVFVVLLEAVVLSDVVEVFLVDDNGPLHLHLGHHARLDPPSDGDITSKRAFLVNVGALHGLLWRLEAQTNVLLV